MKKKNGGLYLIKVLSIDTRSLFVTSIMHDFSNKWNILSFGFKYHPDMHVFLHGKEILEIAKWKAFIHEEDSIMSIFLPSIL